MLLVIFGAGASYDSCSSLRVSGTGVEHERPPLADQLFNARPQFRAALSQFPKGRYVVSRLENPLPGSTVEHELELLQAQAKDDPERPRQIASIRFYLRLMLWECVKRWLDEAGQVTNYMQLMDSIRHNQHQNETLLLTFNYDTMLEHALEGMGSRFRSFDDYVNGPYKLIKLHGSVNWVHNVTTRLDNIANTDERYVTQELIERAAELQFGDMEIVDAPVSRIGDKAFFPALAIPTETKASYECPEDHVEKLAAHLEKVTEIIVVGWRAEEKTFLHLLASKLMGTVPKIVIVAGSNQGGNEVKEKLMKAGIQTHGTDWGNITVSNGGFSEFVRRDADRFLGSREKVWDTV